MRVAAYFQHNMPRLRMMECLPYIVCSPSFLREVGVSADEVWMLQFAVNARSVRDFVRSLRHIETIAAINAATPATAPAASTPGA